MPAELRRAHTANDKAVMAAYGFSTKNDGSRLCGRVDEIYNQKNAMIKSFIELFFAQSKIF